MLVTPKQLEQRSEFYHQFGILLSAGISATQALDQLYRNPPARSLRESIGQFRDFLQQGYTITDAAQRMGGWIPSFDAALIEAGDKSGRLDQCCKLLSVYYSDRARMAKQMISDLMYPVFVFHFAAVLFPFITFITSGNFVTFGLTVAAILGPLYAVTFFLIYAGQARHGEAWRSKIESFVRPIPMLGTARHFLALARLAAALEALLTAGVPIIEGWTLAATASGSPAIRRTVQSWKDRLQNGTTPAQLVSQSNLFPEMFANLYHTGEISGQLDQTLVRMHMIYQEEGTRKMRMVAQWTPKVVYGIVAMIVAFKIISFYMGYFGQLNQIMDMK